MNFPGKSSSWVRNFSLQLVCPIHNFIIVLGKQLGAGAFGVVVKGLASGILPYEEETTVAVKMVKQTADNEVSLINIPINCGRNNRCYGLRFEQLMLINQAM